MEETAPRTAQPAAASVAHLDDDERTLVLGVLRLAVRAVVVFDEVYGLLPPQPQSPPTKRPTVALMKQGRAFGVGRHRRDAEPNGLDYRTLSRGRCRSARFARRGSADSQEWHGAWCAESIEQNIELYMWSGGLPD